MENKGNHCYMCRYLQRYYVLGNKRFNKTKVGRCDNKKGEPVDVHGCCEMFSRKPYPRKVSPIIKYSLNNLLAEITAIREVIEEIGNGDEDEEM